MLGTNSSLRVSIRAVAMVLPIAVAHSARADVFPISTSGQARAFAWTNPNPFQNWDSESYFGSTGDFAANAYQFDSTQPLGTPFITSEVTGSSTGHVDPSGANGNAELETHWVATNGFPIPNAQSGSFESENFFKYTFITDTPGTITIDLDTVSNLPNVVPPDPQNVVNYAMAINHTVTFNGQYTELLLNDQQTLVYPIDPGFHQLILERHPNTGASPWPNCDVFSTSSMTFTIETESAPDPILGDLDCDQDVDPDDVPAMTLALLDPGLYAEFHGCIENGDFNGDEMTDACDLQSFVDLMVNGP